MGRKAGRQTLFGFHHDRVGGAAKLKSAAALQVLTFEKQLRSKQLIEPVAGHDRSAVHILGDALCGFSHGGKIWCSQWCNRHDARLSSKSWWLFDHPSMYRLKRLTGDRFGLFMLTSNPSYSHHPSNFYTHLGSIESWKRARQWPTRLEHH
jgi:hypothetical protein